jgi:hypothetical protein
MMPVHVVAPMMTNFLNPDASPIADPYDKVSILFIVIGEFDKFTREKNTDGTPQLLERAIHHDG